MIKKIADAINMSFEIPSSEKEVAESAVEYLEAAANQLRFAEDHLDIMYQIFNKHDDIPTESIVKNRGIIDKYKEKVKENYNSFKKSSYIALGKLNHFAVDTQITELLSSFQESMKEVENEVNNLLKILGKHKLPNFKANSLAAIDNIKKQGKQVANLIKDRIIEHINTNIIAETWASTTSKDLNMVVEEKVPHLIQLYKDRGKEKGKGNKIPVEPTQPQALNPSDAQSVWTPTHTRTREIGE